MSYSKSSVPGPPDLFHLKEHIENDNIYVVQEAASKRDLISWHTFNNLSKA